MRRAPAHAWSACIHPRLCAREKACDRAYTTCKCENTRTNSVCVCVYVPGIHHGLHLSPKAHERHILWAPIIPLPTTTSSSAARLSRQTTPRAAVRIQWLLPFTPANSITIACRYYNYSRVTTPSSIYLSPARGWFGEKIAYRMITKRKTKLTCVCVQLQIANDVMRYCVDVIFSSNCAANQTRDWLNACALTARICFNYCSASNYCDERALAILCECILF